jgi:hypothetical protein
MLQLEGGCRSRVADGRSVAAGREGDVPEVPQGLAARAGNPKVIACACELVARGWSDAQKRAYVIADNQLALNAGWDRELLGLELGELKLGGFDLALTGFGELELGDLLADRTQGLTDPDDAPEAPMTGTSAMPSWRAAKILAWPAITPPASSASTGFVQPHSFMLAASCAI